jgi:hypothetical protein
MNRVHSGEINHRCSFLGLSGKKLFPNDDSSVNSGLPLARQRTSSAHETTLVKMFKLMGKKMINKYEIEKVLGKGSFATVHLG